MTAALSSDHQSVTATPPNSPTPASQPGNATVNSVTALALDNIQEKLKEFSKEQTINFSVTVVKNDDNTTTEIPPPYGITLY